jgi:hypothetical protein
MPILRRKSILGVGLILEKDMFWGKICFWKERANFGVRAIGGKKETCGKRRKNDAHADKPNHDRVRFFEKYCNGYKPIK